MPRDFYTPYEAAQILEVSLRRILERSAAGEIEAEKDPRTGRWRIPKESLLDGSETGRLSEGGAEWRQEKALLMDELQRERARADKELERANGEQEKAARERERGEVLRRRLRYL